jgi:hypothetical protein
VRLRCSPGGDWSEVLVSVVPSTGALRPGGDRCPKVECAGLGLDSALAAMLPVRRRQQQHCCIATDCGSATLPSPTRPASVPNRRDRARQRRQRGGRGRGERLDAVVIGFAGKVNLRDSEARPAANRPGCVRLLETGGGRSGWCVPLSVGCRYRTFGGGRDEGSRLAGSRSDRNCSGHMPRRQTRSVVCSRWLGKRHHHE